MIEFENVTRTYGTKEAVRSLTLTIPPGELFALLGPSGAGKTTSIKMLVGLLQPSRGSVRVCGHDVVHNTRAAHSTIGYVPDEAILYDKLSGREFLWFIADMFGMHRDVAAARIDDEIEAFELADFAHLNRMVRETPSVPWATYPTINIKLPLLHTKPFVGFKTP